MRDTRITERLYGIQKKLIIYIMLLILLALLLVTAAVSIIAGKNVKENVVEQYGYVSDRFYSSFQGMYESLNAITENCITNNNVQNSLKNKELSVYDKEVISRTLQFVDEGNIDYYLYMDNKDNVYTRNSYTADIERLKKSYLYLGLGEDYSKVKLFWERDILSGKDEKALYAGRYVRQQDRSYEPGVIYLRLDNTVFDELTSAAGDDALNYFLLDSKGEICSSRYGTWAASKKVKGAVEEEIRKLCSEGGGTGSVVDGDRGLIYVRHHAESGFTAVTFVQNGIVYKTIWQILGVIVLIFFAVLGIAFPLSRYLAGKFTRPIRYISGLMENFDDAGLTAQAVLHTNTELDEIGKSYNKMLDRIAGLIGQVTFKERELRKAELDTLLYQIHPHFLYNTLDTVYMLARISKEETIMKMIQSLSKYLRINLSNGAEEITAARELEHVSAYMDIQNIRNSGLFTYELEADEEVREIPVIKMILQPIVENCIKHAFEEDGEQLRIWITAKQRDGYVVFTVANNGALMPAKDQERLNRLETVDISAIDSVVTKAEGGYGVWNVVKRLRLRYQEQIRFYYTVSDGKTTCVIGIKKELMEFHENEESKKRNTATALPDGDAFRM